jgi:hypothetical protein
MSKREEMIGQSKEMNQTWIGILCDMITMSCMNYIILTPKNDEMKLKFIISAVQVLNIFFKIS